MKIELQAILQYLYKWYWKWIFKYWQLSIKNYRFSLSESKKGLQNCLNNLEKCCDKVLLFYLKIFVGLASLKKNSVVTVIDNRFNSSIFIYNSLCEIICWHWKLWKLWHKILLFKMKIELQAILQYLYKWYWKWIFKYWQLSIKNYRFSDRLPFLLMIYWYYLKVKKVYKIV